MSNRNKILIVVGLAVILIAGCVLLIYDSYRKSSTNLNGAAANLPNTYTIAVTEKGAVFTGQLLDNGSTGQLTDAQLNQYLTISTNATDDFMTILCPTGYKTTAATATYGISVGRNLDLGANADIDPNKQGTITVSCSKQ